MMITAEAMYDLTKSGQIDSLNRLTDHKQLKIYAGGGADYAISAAFLKARREDAKKFMSGICEGIALARNDKSQALSFVAKTGRNLDAAGIEYLYRLYTTDVIPARPHLKPRRNRLGNSNDRGVDASCGDDETARSHRCALSARTGKRRPVQLLERLGLHLDIIHHAFYTGHFACDLAGFVFSSPRCRRCL